MRHVEFDFMLENGRWVTIQGKAHIHADEFIEEIDGIEFMVYSPIGSRIDRSELTLDDVHNIENSIAEHIEDYDDSYETDYYARSED